MPQSTAVFPRTLFVSLFIVFTLMLAQAGSAYGQVTEQVIYSFTGNSGAVPRTNLVYGPAGQLFGMTSEGGVGNPLNCGRSGCGTVYELLPGASGTWSYRHLYAFQGGSDGLGPYGNIVFDAAGNLYGTTSAGGTFGVGTVFKLTPGTRNAWRETVLHSFGGSSNGDGAYPYAGLTIDAAGNLYGTTSEGGTGLKNDGAVFKLAPNGEGTWTESVIYSFSGGTTDGAGPLAEVTFDGSGNLYGTTAGGGTKRFGTVFELTPGSGGAWTETILYTFLGEQLAVPRAPLWIDSTGAIYGTTCGQRAGQGSVFELTNSGSGWTETSLHNFGTGQDGACPISALTPNSFGSLYGITGAGGPNNLGVVYKVEPNNHGTWSEDVLYSFPGGGAGGQPWAGITFGAGDTFYGTTTTGGANNYGAVFKITP